METTRNRIEEYVKELTSDLTRELKKICDEVQTLSGVTMDMASHCNQHTTNASSKTRDALNEVRNIASTVGDIFNEVKPLASAIHTLDSNISAARLAPTMSPPSLMNELNTADRGAQLENEGGWRTLGSKRIWRANWTEYDERMLRLVQQQKARDKAIKRRKNNKNKWNRRTNSSNRNPHEGFSGHHLFNNVNNNNMGSRSNYNTNYSNKNYSNNIDHRSSQQTALPLDRDLLAAARVAFSRPPPTENPNWIRFQRGETINPYPVNHQASQPNPSSSTTPPPGNSQPPCEACAHRNSNFHPN